MKRTLLAALPLLTACASAVHAQTAPPVSVSVGVFSPATADTRHRAGSTLVFGSLRYALPSRAAVSPTRTVIEGTAAYGKKGSEASVVVSLTGGQVFSLSSGKSPLSAGAAYVGAGAGVYALDLSGRHAFGRVGIYGEAGYNFSSAVFVGASYRFVDQGSGASLVLGTRF